MANTLYDENYGGRYGNCHLAVGSSYTDTYAGNPARRSISGTAPSTPFSSFRWAADLILQKVWQKLDELARELGAAGTSTPSGS